MKKTLVYLVLLGVSCTALGIVSGIAIEKRYTKTHLPQIVRQQMAQHPGALKRLGKRFGKHPGQQKQQMIKRIVEKLDLSEEQKEQIKSILDATKKEIDTVRNEFRAKLAQFKEDSHEKISQVLTEDQKVKFEEITKGEKWREKPIGPRR